MNSRLSTARDAAHQLSVGSTAGPAARRPMGRVACGAKGYGVALAVLWLMGAWHLERLRGAETTNALPPLVRIDFSNGDRLTGQWVAGPLRLATGAGEVRLEPHDLARLERAADGAVTIHLTNGKTNAGKLTSGTVLMRLEIESQLSIPFDKIVAIYRHTDRQERSVAGTNLLQNLVWLPPGQFLMGSPPAETGRDPDEGPQTRVIIPKGLWIAKYEVTQAEYHRLMGNNPSSITDDPLRPVDRVNWFEAVDYCRQLTQLAEADGSVPKGFLCRLPTEAEWEYACRAGSTGRFCYGDDKNETQLDEYAWFLRNSDSATHPVGAKKPNAWGVHDMHGNVWEWCLDRWEGALPGGTVTNTPAFSQGTLRVTRGGSWLYDAKSCRSANRDDYAPANRCSDIGFRIVVAPLE